MIVFVGIYDVGFEVGHEGYGFGVRNEEGDAILEYATAYDLVLPNACFKKDSHLITLKVSMVVK